MCVLSFEFLHTMPPLHPVPGVVYPVGDGVTAGEGELVVRVPEKLKKKIFEKYTKKC
jgi:hypothetical protein